MLPFLSIIESITLSSNATARTGACATAHAWPEWPRIWRGVSRWGRTSWIVITAAPLLCSMLIAVMGYEAGAAATTTRGDGVPLLLEASRRGGHLWVHFGEPALASRVRLAAAVCTCVCSRGCIETRCAQHRWRWFGYSRAIRESHRKSRGWYPFLAVLDDGVAGAGWELGGGVLRVGV